MEIVFGLFMDNTCSCRICLGWVIDPFIEIIIIHIDQADIMVEEVIMDQKQEEVQCMEPTQRRLKNQTQISFREDLPSQDGLHHEVGLEVDLEVPVLENNLSL